MRSTIFRGILAATAVFVAACDSPDSVAPATASAPSHVTVSADIGGNPWWRTIDQYVWVSCGNGGAGETLHVTGDLRYEMQRMQDSSGTYHLNVKSNTSSLTAVGLTSGTVFRGMMTERGISRAEDYLNEDVRFADIIRFEAAGSREAYSLMVTSHYIIDQGTYVLWDETWNEVCR
jgi:hypothetical protein